MLLVLCFYCHISFLDKVKSYLTLVSFGLGRCSSIVVFIRWWDFWYLLPFGSSTFNNVWYSPYGSCRIRYLDSLIRSRLCKFLVTDFTFIFCEKLCRLFLSCDHLYILARECLVALCLNQLEFYSLRRFENNSFYIFAYFSGSIIGSDSLRTYQD